MPATCVLGQGFGGNLNPSYSEGGLKGHPGIDEGCGFGTSGHQLYPGYVYKTLTVQHPSNDGTGFTGIFTLVDDGLESFEWLVGHCDPLVSEGTYVDKGEITYTEANHGKVYSGNIEITLPMQRAGNHAGAHRHYQKRPVMPVTKTSWAYEYLIGSVQSPYRSPEGFYFQIFNYWNGYNGCISPLQPVFYRDLTVGTSGYDVFVLQRLLVRKGFLAVEPTAFFGMLTAKAVAAYQSASGIAPTSYFGPKTRTQALRELSPLPVLSGQ